MLATLKDLAYIPSMQNLDHLLPSLKDIIKTYQLSANKTLGQNFLLDMNLLRKIAQAAGAKPHTQFLEIGPGPGGLTRALLSEGVDKLIVIEKDKRCLPILQEIQQVYPQRLQIIQGDALKIDFNNLFESSFHIATNLPYNISSDFIISLLSDNSYPKKWCSATMMLQKEFATRLKAEPNCKEYGRLSVLAALTAQVKIAFNVHPSNFTPPPKVTSCITQIIPNSEKPDCNLDMLKQVTHAAFSQRRKMLRTSLKQVSNDPVNLCQKVGISSDLRADHVTPQDFVKICKALEG